MPSTLNPYISFKDNARAAMEFYKEVFGGELVSNTFAEFGTSGPDADKLMHARLETPAGYTIMAADTPEGMPFEPGNTITVSLSGDDTDELTGYWNKLAEGGQVSMPLEKQPWGDFFGMCTDKFGVAWMVNVADPAEAAGSGS